nr:helix-turn-helix domain-containing protein [Rhodoligotrophos defluvii]
MLVVCGAYGVRQSELAAATRSRADIARARQIAMYLAHVSCGLTLTEVGRLFGRDRTTAAHACRQIEDERDDPTVDLALSALDSTLRYWRSSDWQSPAA